MLTTRLAEPEDLEFALAQGGAGSRWGREVMQTWHRNMTYVPWVVTAGEQRVAFAWVHEINYDEGQLFTPLLHPAYWWDEVIPVLLEAIGRWAHRAHLLRVRATVRHSDTAWQTALEKGQYSPMAYFQVWDGSTLQLDRQKAPVGQFSAVGAHAQSGGLSYVHGIWRRWQMADIRTALAENCVLELGQGVYMPWWLDNTEHALFSSWAQFGDDPTWRGPVLYHHIRELQRLAYALGAQVLRLVLPRGLGNDESLPDCLLTDEVTICQYEVN